MAEPLKNMYNKALLDKLAGEVKKQYKAFNTTRFLAMVFDKHWETRELKQRMRHITHCLHACLPLPYEKQIALMYKVSPHFNGFIAILFPDFVEVYGLEHPDISIPALEHFTPYSSSEFAVRPYFVKYEKRMLKQHAIWAIHKNHHVRRLASEGLRPRLPWAMALPAFKKDPSKILPVLELLKDDESEYVRRSVANCLNDISKDHPDVVLQTINKWKNHSAGTDWIIKHASRGLLKKGHTEALSHFGLNHKIKADVYGLEVSKKRIRIGDGFTFQANVKSAEKKTQRVRLEYAIYFMKANGKPSRKIFQIGTYELAPGGKMEIKRSHRFADLTTRKHYKGEHKLVMVLNGKEAAEQVFELS